MHRFKKFEKTPILENHLNLGGRNPAGEEISLNSAYMTRAGKPWVPIMGEFHFSRCNRSYWTQELTKMKAGGITLVPSYLFWIHHEEIEGELNFSGNNDIRAFVEECGKSGLDVEIRIGPWCHGECRNGGLPDWLLKKDFPLRHNNPGYMACVQKWYAAIAGELKGLFYRDGGPIVAIQLENEYTEGAEHLAELKKLAIACGMIVPLYTVTGWNDRAGARIPVDEVMPLFGGYCDAPWDHGTQKLLPSTHYFFNQMRNDSAIGEDLRVGNEEADDGWRLPYERYPFATCELGGGLQNTHHRRYIIEGMDIYAVSLVKLGCGNNLPGSYMYHGGTNPVGKLSTFQESKATGYPNDYTILSYDFQAPLSEYGEVREQYRLLNLLHLFLQDFQEWFAPLSAVDAMTEVSRNDVDSLRYGMRTDGKSGVVFINHYQRRSKLADIDGAVIDTGCGVVFPPINVRGDVSFFMPFRMKLGSVELEYATAQPVCRHGNTFFFVEIPGIAAQYQFEPDSVKTEADFTVGDIRIITLPWDAARYLRCLNGGIYIGNTCDLYWFENQIHAVQDGRFEYSHWTGNNFETLQLGEAYTPAVPVFEPLTEAPFKIPELFAPELRIGGKRKVTWKKIKVDRAKGFIEIPDIYDAAQLYADGKLVADNFYYGKPWRLPASILYGKECYLVYSEYQGEFYREF